jgi:translation initiation factor IF-3
MTPQQALSIAEEKGLDLVEIAATATPPVCRIMNSGKFFYQQDKREAEARKHQKHIVVKELKFRPKIDEHDFQFKRRNAERFLLEGNKVKSTVIFRGRELVHSEIGHRILTRLAVALTEVALVEVPPRQEGMTMVQILSPKKEPPKAKKPAEDGKAAKKAAKKAKAKDDDGEQPKSKAKEDKDDGEKPETAAAGAATRKSEK